MNKEHVLLAVIWISYCLVHSLLASNTVKKYALQVLRTNYKFYRPAYSILAFVSLGLLLWYHFLITGSYLFHWNLRFIPGIILSLPGVIMMIVCIRKYFYELSGLQALQNESNKNTLQQKGLHKYVRHPLYLGTLLFIWGLFIIFPYLNNLIACLIITIYTVIGIELEEKKLREEFGDVYREYSKKVPRLIPGW